MPEHLVRIDGLLESSLAIPEKDIEWGAPMESPRFTLVSIRVEGIAAKDAQSLDTGLIDGKTYQLRFHPNTVINDAKILKLALDEPATCGGMTIYRSAEILIEYLVQPHVDD
jgi:hypothetical protein